MTRTRRKLKGVNIGQRFHDLLGKLAELHGDSANGSIRAQAEAAIVDYAQRQGLEIPLCLWAPREPLEPQRAPLPASTARLAPLDPGTGERP